MNKFGRNYVLLIENDTSASQVAVGAAPIISSSEYLTITLPFTMEFDITRNTLSSANVCQIRIKNLSLKNRNLIRHNQYDYGNYKSIQLQAGYGTNLAALPLIFKGNISQAFSVREGVDFVTQIECYDGGYAYSNGQINQTFIAGTPLQTVIRTLASSLPNVSLGAIGTFPGILTRANTYNGNTIDILRELTGGAFFIDNEKANVLGTAEVLPQSGPELIIRSDTGLLGTPVLEATTVHFNMIFEPSLQVGNRIYLDSLTAGNFNGQYKTTTVKHRGVISSAISGTAITTGEFFALAPGAGN